MGARLKRLFGLTSVAICAWFALVALATFQSGRTIRLSHLGFTHAEDWTAYQCVLITFARGGIRCNWELLRLRGYLFELGVNSGFDADVTRNENPEYPGVPRGFGPPPDGVAIGFAGFGLVWHPSAVATNDGYDSGGSIVLPAWFVALTSAGLGTLLLLPKRPKPGECRTCGYNLKANTSGVCPECGSAVPMSSTTRS